MKQFGGAGVSSRKENCSPNHMHTSKPQWRLNKWSFFRMAHLLFIVLDETKLIGIISSLSLYKSEKELKKAMKCLNSGQKCHDVTKAG